MIAVLEVGLGDLAWNPLSRSFGRTVEERGLLLSDNDSDGCFQLRSEETRIRREDPGARSIRARRVLGEFSVQDKMRLMVSFRVSVRGNCTLNASRVAVKRGFKHRSAHVCETPQVPKLVKAQHLSSDRQIVGEDDLAGALGRDFD